MAVAARAAGGAAPAVGGATRPRRRSRTPHTAPAPAHPSGAPPSPGDTATPTASTTPTPSNTPTEAPTPTAHRHPDPYADPHQHPHAHRHSYADPDPDEHLHPYGHPHADEYAYADDDPHEHAHPDNTPTPTNSPTPTNTPTNTPVPTPNAVADGYGAIGNVRIQPTAPGVLANDTDSSGTGITVTAFGPATGLETAPGTAGTSAQGGNLTVNANGSFSYNPPPGFTGSDTFRYRVTNGAGGSNIGTVTVTVSGMIWFVDNALATNGDGRLSAPYNCLTGPQCFTTLAADEAGDNIFLFSGSTSYTGGVTLLNNQRLIGQGAIATLASITGLTVPAGSDLLPATSGTNPTIVTGAGHAITLGQNNTVRGLTIGNRSPPPGAPSPAPRSAP